MLCILIFTTVSSCGSKKDLTQEQIQKDKRDLSAENVQIPAQQQIEYEVDKQKPVNLVMGCEQLKLFIDSLKGKKIAIVSNQTSVIGTSHLVDSLIKLGITFVKVFTPEHGFRGDADAGEKVSSGIDAKTGLPLISLYGSNKKPTPAQMANVDIVLFDIQDVGVRFYTYISTLHYVMEACAEAKKKLIVLDRPNPNGHYVDGPVREPAFKSFVGMHPVPVVHGMTIGEYAKMVNEEGWLSDYLKCDLTIIPMKGYSHKVRYALPIAPSPNLRSELAIAIYPSLCLFEATTVSIGRGTPNPFEVYGHPYFPTTDFTFMPVSSFGAKNPLWENKECFGFDLKVSNKKRLYELKIDWLISAKEYLGDSIPFINRPGFFDRLAGTSTLREQIMRGVPEKEIRASWAPSIEAFRKIRQKYLIYEN
jgi:uncharacterized protein YbbC (DUF1343 family)